MLIVLYVINELVRFITFSCSSFSKTAIERVYWTENVKSASSSQVKNYALINETVLVKAITHLPVPEHEDVTN